jgi:periodic tryptophan protein 2
VFLLIVDGNKWCLLLNLHRQVVLHRISFKNAVKAVAFSPCGSCIAVAADKLL